MKNYRLYAGIGSRQTPSHILKIMTSLATWLETKNFKLRSGGATGADSAFADGTKIRELFFAEDATEDAIGLTSHFHPNWPACSNYVRKLHGRNMMILFGRDLKVPVEFIICWTNNGKLIGGTSQALRIADHYNIPVVNLGLKEVELNYAKIINNLVG